MTTLKTCLYFLPLLLLSCYNNKLLYERIQEIEKKLDSMEYFRPDSFKVEVDSFSVNVKVKGFEQ